MALLYSVQQTLENAGSYQDSRVWGGNVKFKYFTYEASAAVAGTDVILLCKLPAGSVPVDILLGVEGDGATGSTLDMGLYSTATTPVALDVDCFIDGVIGTSDSINRIGVANYSVFGDWEDSVTSGYGIGRSLAADSWLALTPLVGNYTGTLFGWVTYTETP